VAAGRLRLPLRGGRGRGSRQPDQRRPKARRHFFTAAKGRRAGLSSKRKARRRQLHSRPTRRSRGKRGRGTYISRIREQDRRVEGQRPSSALDRADKPPARASAPLKRRARSAEGGWSPARSSRPSVGGARDRNRIPWGPLGSWVPGTTVMPILFEGGQPWNGMTEPAKRPSPIGRETRASCALRRGGCECLAPVLAVSLPRPTLTSSGRCIRRHESHVCDCARAVPSGRTPT